MKKTILYIAMTLIGLTACTDSFLVVKPTAQILESDFYTTQERIEKALVAAYDPLTWPDMINDNNSKYYPQALVSDVMSDDVKVGGGDVNDIQYLHKMRDFAATPELTPIGIWVAYYSGINRVNIVIDKMPGITDISDTRKDQILAEAHGLRAYYYYWLWKLWGNVPYFSTNPTTTPFIVPQITADQLYPHIISDLDYAIQSVNLNEITKDVTQKGRVTKDMVRMLKAQTVLYQKDASKYSEVLIDMEAIITSSRYSLQPSFASIFKDAGEWCAESIWEINYTDNGNRGWDIVPHTGGSVYPQLIGINASEGPDFVKGWGFEPVEKALYDLYETGDQRRDYGILNFAKYKLAETSASYTPRFEDTGYFNLKYIGRIGGNSGNTSDPMFNFRNNLRIFRYAETLLIASELQLRIPGGDITKAQTSLNAVRKRAFNSTTHSVTANLDNILKERRIELAFEGQRFWDLVRFDKAIEVLGARGYSDAKKHLPIPSSEIDKAKGTLTQNPY